MVEKPNKSTKVLSISLIPRKIMLEKQSKEKGNLELTSLNVPQNGVVPLSGKTEKKTNQTRREDQTRMCLLHTIATYLKENGFSKTLYAFLSEAQLEVDSWKAYSFDLEDLICKHLETRLTEAADLQIDHLAVRNKEESNYDVSRKSSLSKNRKKSSGNATNTETESNRLEVENGNFDLIPDPSHNMDKSLRESAEHVIGPTEILLNNESVDMNLKSKEKKKKRKSVSENTANSNELETSVDLDRIDGKKVKSDAEITNHEILSGLSPIKSKVKKNRKGKLISDPSTENNEQAGYETNQEDNHEILSVASPLKSKEKYKKNKLITVPHAENIEQANPAMNQELAKEKSKGLDFLQGAKKSDIQQLGSVPEAKNLLDGAHIKSKEKKKKQKSSSKGLDNEIVAEIGQGAVQDGDKHISKDLEAAGGFNESWSPLKTVSKKIKSDADDIEGGSQVKSKGKKNKKHKLISEESEEVEGQIHQSERRKVEDHTKIKECLDQFEREGSTEKATEPRNAAMAKQPEEKKKEGSASTKTVKKEDTRCSEPKTANAFRRVNIDEVEFANEKLQDNSYWAKSGADSGYGAKAQGILGQVRGKDFRHEKTKKKRGSYRGGQIDLQSHSIKFNDSDEE